MCLAYHGQLLDGIGLSVCSRTLTVTVNVELPPPPAHKCSHRRQVLLVLHNHLIPCVVPTCLLLSRKRLKILPELSEPSLAPLHHDSPTTQPSSHACRAHSALSCYHGLRRFRLLPRRFRLCSSSGCRLLPMQTEPPAAVQSPARVRRLRPHLDLQRRTSGSSHLLFSQAARSAYSRARTCSHLAGCGRGAALATAAWRGSTTSGCASGLHLRRNAAPGSRKSKHTSASQRDGPSPTCRAPAKSTTMPRACMQQESRYQN